MEQALLDKERKFGLPVMILVLVFCVGLIYMFQNGRPMAGDTESGVPSRYTSAELAEIQKNTTPPPGNVPLTQSQMQELGDFLRRNK